MADGTITIDTTLKTDKFDREIVNLEKKMKRAEQKAVGKQVQISGLEKEIEDFEIAKQKVQQYEQELRNLQTMKISERSKSYIQQIMEANDKLQEQKSLVQSQASNIENTKIKLQQVKSEYEGITNEVRQYKNQIEGVEIQRQQAEVEKMKGSFDGVGSSIKNAIRKVGKLALGIFGVRSAYMMVRRAASELGQYDPQFATDLEYIRFVLTEAIAPVLRWIVEMAMTLLQLINAIASSLFGINLFSSGSAENFQKMKAGAGGVSKAVKEIKKQLMGFDEVNVLTSQSDTGTAGGGSGGFMPSMDLSQTSQKVQEFVEKVKGWWEDLGKVLDDAVNMPDDTFGHWTEAFRGMAITARGAYHIVDGVFDEIGGRVQVIHGVITGDMEEVQKGFERLFNGLKNIALGIGEIIMGVIYTIIGAIGGLFKTLTDWDAMREAIYTGIDKLVKNLDREKRGIKDVKKAQEDLNEAKEEAVKVYDNYIDAVDRSEEALQRLEEAQDETGLSGEELNTMVEQGILDYKDMTEQQKRVYKAYLDNKNAQDNLKASTERLTTATNKQKQATLDEAEAVAYDTGKYDEYKNAVVNAFNSGELSAEEARERIEKAMAGMSESSRKTFVEDLPDDIKEGIDPSRYENAWTRFRNTWNSWIDGLKRNINLYINGNFSSGGGRRIWWRWKWCKSKRWNILSKFNEIGKWWNC